MITVHEGGSFTVNTFLLTWYLIGIASPFVVFFTYGFFARWSKVTASTKLAVGWGSACFGIIAWFHGLVVFCAFTGDCNIPESPSAFLFGYMNGAAVLTLVVIYQSMKNSDHKEKAERLRKEAYSY